MIQLESIFHLYCSFSTNVSSSLALRFFRMKTINAFMNLKHSNWKIATSSFVFRYYFWLRFNWHKSTRFREIMKLINFIEFRQILIILTTNCFLTLNLVLIFKYSITFCMTTMLCRRILCFNIWIFQSLILFIITKKIFNKNLCVVFS